MQKELENSGIKIISKEDWMVNSPDLAPMEFALNGIFKWALFEKQANSLLASERVMKSVR
jgi:hypothetical protein